MHVGVLFTIGLVPAFFKKLIGLGSFFHFLRVFYPLLLLGFLYHETDFLNNLIFKENLDVILASIEYKWFGSQPALEFSRKVSSNLWAELMYFGYFAYYLLIFIVPLYFYFTDRKEIAEKIIFVVILSFLTYYLFFIVFPVAGPQFYFAKYQNELPLGYISGFLVRLAQQTGEAPTAAFPSSHVAICLILWFCVYKEQKPLAYTLLPFVLLLILSTIYIRAHYVIDIFAAFLSAPLVGIFAFKIYRVFNRKSKHPETNFKK